MHGLAQAASGYHKVLEENRRLYNEVQDLKGNPSTVLLSYIWFFSVVLNFRI